MKKYIVNYAFDDEDNRYVAVCPDFFGFIVYCDTLQDLRTQTLKMLKIYTKDFNLGGSNIEFVKVTLEKENTL